MKTSDLPPRGETESVHSTTANIIATNVSVVNVILYLQHVVDDVEFYDRLTPDQVVHHGVIHIVHHEITQSHDETLQNITHLSRLQDTRSTANTNTRKTSSG